MDNQTNFDKLIINLSTIEKKELLEKMEMSIDLSQEPLVSQEETAESDFQQNQLDYETLNVLQKIVLFLQSLVKQKDIPTLLKEYKVNLLRKKYFNNSELADFKTQVLKKAFYDELAKLKEPCRFFRKPLRQIFSYDNKQDFYAFIGGIVLPDLQRELLDKTDPWILEKEEMERDSSEIKAEIDEFFNMKMESVSDLDCSIMNEACQSLYSLHLLSNYDIGAILKSFDTIVPGAEPVCRIEDVHESLLELSGIIKSLNKPPTVRALEALFLYENSKEGPGEILSRKMMAADTFLSIIRNFNKNVPLENLVRVLSGDLSKGSQTPPLVDDWFRVFRKFWSSRITRTYAFFVNERKKNDSEKDICSLTGVRYIKPIEKYTRNHYFPGSPAMYEKSLAFVQSFLSEILPNRFYSTFMIIRREGDFYKKDNKAEFDKVLAYIDMLGKKFTGLKNIINASNFPVDHSLFPGDAEEQTYRNAVVHALEHLDMEIEPLVSGFVSHMRLMAKVLQGIVVGDGGAYDTLSNISSIGGKANNELRETFKLLSLLINKIVRYISEMKVLEEKEL
ncbi:DUF5312 family protein [Spirochaeta isovalerica]|uniref:Uncharacterized protein n=1 Tax=Spirochaeta isovalerica TaxID=150 RepID=A0A841R753_9SPIO|nr:DUF5312 family protein [Spirochaeta isovalerica]MBB6479037.1 hypothetical protein [Spirochaeta isovalerica]